MTIAQESFAPLVQQFFAEDDEGHGEATELCVYLDGRKVVDVSRGGYPAGGVQVVRSASKGVLALLAAMLHERGEVDLDAPVADVWPEFAQQGKKRVTIRLLLAHQAGLPVFDEPLSAADALSWQPAVEMLERQRPRWEPGTQHGYHDLTFGWLVGEVLRRATGRDVSRLVTEEFSHRLSLDLWIGTPMAELARVRPLQSPPTGRSALPAPQGFDRGLLAGALDNPDLGGLEHSIEYLTAEVPAANCVSNARSLCRLFAASVAPVDGTRLVGAKTLGNVTAPRAEGPDLVVGWYRRYASGFMLPEATRPMGGVDSACFGHYGQGGVLVFADPETSLAFAYATTMTRSYLGSDPRTSVLARLALECARRA
ncbi:serine hydrolase domain-containing protein [Streptomyces sp. NPDC090029]|uniref:serine hydrolase domain-containing protein n=1 Tax=Streptomyces sp. NPDC090029 TaxID=3365924 RepID=UPI0037FB1C01